MAQRFHQIVAAIVWQDDKILLVQQKGPSDAVASWALPGGVVEAGERLTEALARELREETGITPEQMGPLVYIAQLDSPAEKYQTVTSVFQVEKWSGTIQPADPDKFILRAAFLPVSDAIGKLQESPWRVMREPAAKYLQRKIDTGAAWFYREQPDGSQHLVAQSQNGG